VDMQRCFFNFTMGSAMKIFFGMEADYEGGAPCLYGDAFDTAHSCLMDYTMKSFPILLLADQMPWPFGGSRGLISNLHAALSAKQREFRRAYTVLDRESRRLVAACRADPRKHERRDLLALFMTSEAADTFSDEALRDIILNFMIAGRDTTACLLSWLFYELAVNPEVQAELCAEIDQKVPLGTSPTLSSVVHREMPVLHASIFEALRLHPPVPEDAKVAASDDVLPDGTTVPAGAQMVFSPWCMGRDESVYKEPSIFRPARWIPFVQPLPHEFPVFLAGPRQCIGMDMALFEAKVAAIMLLQQFSFEMSPGEAEKIGEGTGLTMAVANNPEKTSPHLWMLLRPRKTA